jgi:hypothetical protein
VYTSTIVIVVDRKESLGEEILRAADALTEAGVADANLIVAKMQLLAAYKSCEGDEMGRVAEHLCRALRILIQELRLRQTTT